MVQGGVTLRAEAINPVPEQAGLTDFPGQELHTQNICGSLAGTGEPCGGGGGCLRAELWSLQFGCSAGEGSRSRGWRWGGFAEWKCRPCRRQARATQGFLKMLGCHNMLHWLCAVPHHSFPHIVVVLKVF